MEKNAFIQTKATSKHQENTSERKCEKFFSLGDKKIHLKIIIIIIIYLFFY